MNLSLPAHAPLLFRLLLTLLTGGSILPAWAQVSIPKEQLTVALTTPDKPGSLEVDLVDGTIQVQGYSGKTVLISAVSQPRPASGKPTGKPVAPPINLAADERNNHIELNADSYRCPVALTIQVPLHFSLKLGIERYGSITVENVRGELEVSTLRGAITLTQIEGSAVANTLNGNLKATFTKVTTDAPMAFSSLHGDVDVTIPATTKASLKLKSDQGQLHSDYDLVVDKHSPNDGAEPWAYGTLNRGGAEIILNSLNGNVFLRKAR